MKKLIQHILVSATLCLPIGAWAQGVQGKIVSADGALPGATVRVKGAKNATISNENGDFRLQIAKPGQITLQCSFIGYQNLDTTLVVSDAMIS